MAAFSDYFEIERVMFYEQMERLAAFTTKPKQLYKESTSNWKLSKLIGHLTVCLLLVAVSVYDLKWWAFIVFGVTYYCLFEPFLNGLRDKPLIYLSAESSKLDKLRLKYLGKYAKYIDFAVKVLLFVTLIILIFFYEI
jgi:hypothetical protein